jgi:hypothetical protein
MFSAVEKRNMGSVGGFIVVGGRESRLHGEGSQRRVIPESNRPEPDEVQAMKVELKRGTNQGATFGEERQALESRMQGNLARPVWRRESRNLHNWRRYCRDDTQTPGETLGSYPTSRTCHRC